MSLSVAITHAHGRGFQLDLAFEAAGGVTALFGRSGAGKSTLVNAVAGLLRPDTAVVRLDEHVLVDTNARRFLPAYRRRIGYVFQDHRLFPHLSVEGNLRYGRRFAPRGAGPDLAGIGKLLGLTPLLERRPAGLSGGERARVAIGRALLCGPRLLLLDEPLASLDEARKAEILPYLERLRDEARVPMLYVSHNVAEVARLASDVVVIEAGQLVKAGPAAKIFADPELAPAFGIRAAGSVLPGRIEAHHEDGLSEVEVSAGRVFLPKVPAEIGARIRVRVEAQDVMLATRRPEGLSALNILEVTVASVRSGAGPGILVQLSAGQDQVLARITRRSAERLGVAPGLRCFAVIKTVAVGSADIGLQPAPFD